MGPEDSDIEITDKNLFCSRKENACFYTIKSLLGIFNLEHDNIINFYKRNCDQNMYTFLSCLSCTLLEIAMFLS